MLGIDKPEAVWQDGKEPKRSKSTMRSKTRTSDATQNSNIKVKVRESA